MKQYILTGGPGSGKSSILLELEARGHYIIREAAEDYIKLKQAKGVSEPWKEDSFQTEILHLQQQRERNAPANLERIIIDRGLPDGLAYNSPELRRKEIEEAARNTQYCLVFLIEQLDSTDTNGVRRESHTEAKELELKLEQTYAQLGYDTIRIPANSVTERANQILKAIEQYEQVPN